MIDNNLLIQILKKPEAMLDLDIKGWNRVLYEAHMLKLRGRLAHDAKEYGLWEKLPAKVQIVLTNAEIDIESGQRKIMWEVNRVRRALYGFKEKIILVKGGAYITRGLKCAVGRASVDIDILVARKNLDVVENHLFLAGYASQVMNEYDQQYYREWAHELPPLLHPDRMVEVDVHHTILQVTNKLSPKIELMINSADQVEENIYTLCPEDMLLHSIVHQFVDGTVKGSLRNLLEQKDMIEEFCKDQGFWTRFLDRAEELGLTRPVFYSVRYCGYFLDMAVPSDIMARIDMASPGFITLKIMDKMVFRAMVPYGEGRSRMTNYLATNGLYIRSHWLRMPPMMLLKHLTRKYFRRFVTEKA
ncbi:MAG: nucleotidyltransferase family protein [Emcibacter sp.]|nr:nucleotidyltransferase family protein [Emcibacter sp.]